MKVLLGVSGSDESKHALTETIERTKKANDDLTVAVFETDNQEPGREEITEMVETEFEDAGIDADLRYIEGDPGSELVHLAEAEGFDQLVISGGHFSPMGKIQLGPITEFVLLNAQVTVKLIR